VIVSGIIILLHGYQTSSKEIFSKDLMAIKKLFKNEVIVMLSPFHRNGRKNTDHQGTNHGR